MRKKWFVTGTAMLVTMTMLAAGCSNGGNNVNNGGNEGAKPQESTAPVEESIKFPLEKPIELSIFAATDPQVKKDYNEMQMFKQLQEQTNVNVKWTMVSTEQLVEKKNITIASGQLPDAFFGRGVLRDEEVIKLSSQGALIPLEELIEEHAPNLKKVFEQRPEFKKQITAPDGHIYSLPTTVERDFNGIPSALFMNKKWLDDLGLAIPTTVDEFYNALKAFKENDPNGNKKADEIPFSFVFGNNSQNGPNALAGAFGIPNDDNRDHLYIDNGTVKYAPEQPEYENYVQFMSKLYKEGLMDQEVFTHNLNAYQTKIRSEVPQVGAFFTYSLGSVFGNVQNDYVAVPPLKGANGEQGWLRMPVGFSIGSFAITNSNKNPEITMKWIDSIYDEKQSFQFESGPFGLTSKENADGTIEKLTPPEGVAFGAFKHSEAPGNGAVTIVLQDMVDRYIDAQADEKRTYYNMYDPFAPKEILPSMLMTTEDIETLAPIQLDLGGPNGFYSSNFAQFVMNGFTHADWENYVAQLKKMNIDTYVSIYQKYYDAYKAK